MSAEAIARLRDDVDGVHGDVIVNAADLRSLLDAHDSWKSQRDEVHAEMERQTAMKLAERQEKLTVLRAHAEALDALVGALHVLRESDAADVWEEETDAVKAVLAKAGRR